MRICMDALLKLKSPCRMVVSISPYALLQAENKHIASDNNATSLPIFMPDLLGD